MWKRVKRENTGEGQGYKVGVINTLFGQITYHTQMIHIS